MEGIWQDPHLERYEAIKQWQMRRSQDMNETLSLRCDWVVTLLSNMGMKKAVYVALFVSNEAGRWKIIWGHFVN